MNRNRDNSLSNLTYFFIDKSRIENQKVTLLSIIYAKNTPKEGVDFKTRRFCFILCLSDEDSVGTNSICPRGAVFCLLRTTSRNRGTVQSPRGDKHRRVEAQKVFCKP